MQQIFPKREICSGIIGFIRWLKDVILPYTEGKPAALVLDDFSAHWVPEVRAAAAGMNLELIQVPTGLTWQYQPLDAGIFGPMTKIRQRMWREEKTIMPDSRDTEQAAIHRTQTAYSSFSRKSIVHSWQKCYLID
jgi:hypothetical protein